MKNSIFTNKLKTIALSLSVLALVACEDDPSLSLLSDQDVFRQSASTVNNKIDLLWVVDNSGSMAPLQQNVANNFNAFISDFVTKGYDFRIAVITTDAWRTKYYSNETFRTQFRCTSGSCLITPQTNPLIDSFMQNVLVGAMPPGIEGDERGLESLEQGLLHPINTQYAFPRSDAYLAVIFVSDEEDHSRFNGSPIPVQNFVNILDQVTGTSGSTRRYSASSIVVADNNCLNNQRNVIGNPDATIGSRYVEMANLTGGVVGDVCSTNFASTLDVIQQNIASLSTQFYLSRKPIIETLSVKVNGILIPQDAVNGWTYDPNANSIIFHGTAIPAQGASIKVDFDPESVIT